MDFRTLCHIVAGTQLALAIATVTCSACCSCLPMGTAKCCCCIVCLLTFTWIIDSSALMYGVLTLENKYILPWIILTLLRLMVTIVLAFCFIFELCKGEKVCQVMLNIIINAAAATIQIVSLVVIVVLYMCIDLKNYGKEVEYEICREIWKN